MSILNVVILGLCPFSNFMASDSTLDTMVNAIAEQVMVKVKTAVSHLLESAPRVQPALLNVKEAAIYLGRTEQSIQHLIFDRELPVVRVGRRVHLDRKDLEAWIEKNKY
jgi:excisionase family DNA binding protein